MTANPPATGPKQHTLATWLEARRAYVHGEGFLPAIAARFHIPVATVRNRAKAERWGAARTSRFARLTAEVLSQDDPEPQAAPQPTQLPAIPGFPEVQRINDQLERINSLLDTATNAVAIHKLTSALTQLHERRRILLNIPLPGSQRPTRKPGRPTANRDLGAIEASDSPTTG